MLMPERSETFGSSGYRFGFNGQERDDEVSGAGKSYTAEFWQYDSRLGRRFNRDPRPNPSISVYACFANNPIFYTDPEGDSVRYNKFKT
jgi:RHS repeat-associated protein